MSTNHRPKKLPGLDSERSIPVPNLLTAKYQNAAGRPENIKIRNLSRGGLCIETDTSLAIGTSLRLLLNFKGKTVEAQGEIVWNSRENTGYLHGIAFTFMAQEGRQWLNTFVMDWTAEQIAKELDFSGLQTALPINLAADRRSFARLKIPLRIDIGFNKDAALIQTQIFDLSEGGLCLISAFQLKKDQRIFLRLWLSDDGFVSLFGEVKYCIKKNYENKAVHFYGVEFEKTDAQSLGHVIQFLKQKRSELAAIEITLDDIVDRSNLPELP